MPENHKILAKPEENSNDFFLKATTKGEKCGKNRKLVKKLQKNKKGIFCARLKESPYYLTLS